jgi:hypothetical protein
VTADGQLRVANAVSNPDLFWALKGGGGGTFGVVVQATVGAWADSSRIVLSAWLNTTSSASADAIYGIAPQCFQEMKALSSFIQGYCFIYPKAIRILAWLHPRGIRDERWLFGRYKRDWLQSINRLQGLKHVDSVIHEEIVYGSFKEFYDGTFGLMSERLYNSDNDCKRRNEWRPRDSDCRDNLFAQARVNGNRAGNLRNPDPPSGVLDPVSAYLVYCRS